MFGSFFNVALANEVYGDYDFAALDVLANPPYAISLQDAVQAKLASIDTSQSVELKQFVLLSQHEWDTAIDTFVDPDILEPKPKIYDAYGQLYRPIDIESVLSPEQVAFLTSHEGYHLRQWLLLKLVFDLIDSVVDYWSVIAVNRRRWRSISTALHRCLETALQFKPFHMPSRLIPQSIHPIEQAA